MNSGDKILYRERLDGEVKMVDNKPCNTINSNRWWLCDHEHIN